MSYNMNQDHLVQFLKDIYDKECTFKIDEDEIEFIRNGVETLSEKIVNIILSSKLPVDPDPLVAGAINATKRILKRSIIRFGEIGGKATKCNNCKFLKVGSFYEGTKNKFPNEFDLIFPLYHLETSAAMTGKLIENVISISEYSMMIQRSSIMPHMINQESKNLVFECNGRSLNFDKIVGIFGPAIKIQLKYDNKNAGYRDVFVDLVAVTTVTGENLTAIVNEHCVLEPLKDKIYETGRVLIVKKRVSFTETEVDVIKTLSPCHKMVYKLLKYFIHGDNDCIRQRNLFKQEYSSYILKIFMIHHHFSCCAGSTDVTNCSAGTLDVTQCSAYTPDVTQCSANTTDVTKCSADITDVKQCSAIITDVPQCSADITDVTQCSAIIADVPQCSAYSTDVTQCSADITDVKQCSVASKDQSQCFSDPLDTDQRHGSTERRSIIAETSKCLADDFNYLTISCKTIDKEKCFGDVKEDKTYTGNAIANGTFSNQTVALSGDFIKNRTYSGDELANRTTPCKSVRNETFPCDFIEKETYLHDAVANEPISRESIKCGYISNDVKAHRAISKLSKDNGKDIPNTLYRRQYSDCSYNTKQCLLEILDEICNHVNTESLPSLSKKDMYITDDKKELFLLPYLRELNDDLRSILHSVDVYDYDRLKSKRSLSRSVNARYYLDHPAEAVKSTPGIRTKRKFPTLEDLRERGLLKRH